MKTFVQCFPPSNLTHKSACTCQINEYGNYNCGLIRLQYILRLDAPIFQAELAIVLPVEFNIRIPYHMFYRINDIQI